MTIDNNLLAATAVVAAAVLEPAQVSYHLRFDDSAPWNIVAPLPVVRITYRGLLHPDGGFLDGPATSAAPRRHPGGAKHDADVTGTVPVRDIRTEVPAAPGRTDGTASPPMLPGCHGGEHPDAACGKSAPASDGTPSARTRDPRNAFEKTARLHPADGPDAIPDVGQAPMTNPIPRATASGSLEAKLVAVTSRHPKGTILVRVQEKKLYFYRDTGTAYEFRIGTARPGIQFYGRTRVTAKRRNPTWIPTRNQRKLYGNLPASVPPGPKNPLGTRALNLAQGNLRIHGTNEPDTIGKAVSDGCIRLDNADVEALFDLVPIGARVIVER